MTPSRSVRPRGPKPRRVESDQILDAAQTVFARSGLQAASLRAIAREAGCDPALIYYHFASKEAMFEALLGRRIPPLVADLARIADPGDARPTPLRLWEAVRAFHRHLGHDPGFRSLVRGEVVRGTEGIQAHIQDSMGTAALQVKLLLEQGIARGEVRPDLPAPLATFFLLRVHLEILDLLPTVGPRALELDQGTAVTTGERAWLQLYWRGIAAHPESPCPPLPDFKP